MSRKPRIHYKDALYHVICRGNNKEKIFVYERDKQEYLVIVDHYKRKIPFYLYAFCLLDNHAHLLIQVKEIPLSVIMQRIQQVFTQRYNLRYGRTGHVFEQRYKAFLCQKEGYLLNIIRYIHNNPIRACVKEGLGYRWSSHLVYSGVTASSLVDSDLPLSLFAGGGRLGVKEYLQFMHQKEQDKITVWKGKHPEMDKQESGATNSLSLEEVISRVEQIMRITCHEAKENVRKPKSSDFRKAVILLARKYAGTNLKMISEALKIDPSAVSKVLNGRYLKTKILVETIDRFGQLLSCHVKPDPQGVIHGKN